MVKRRGQALVVAILALTVMTASAVALAAAARVELKAARRGVDELRREAAIRGVVQQGIALLEEARTDPATMNSLLREYQQIQWKPFREDAPPDEPSLQYALQIIDASSRLNLNTADQDQLSKLPGVDRDSPGAIAAWKDEENEDEDQVYLANPRPYQSKKRPFDTLEELLMVRDVDAFQYFGVPSTTQSERLEAPPLCELLTAFSGQDNADAGGSPRADVNKASQSDLESAGLSAAELAAQSPGSSVAEDETVVPPLDSATLSGYVLQLITQREQRLAQQNPFRSVTEALQAAGANEQHWGTLIDAWTVDRRAFLPGRVNVNTAPGAVLACLPGMTTEYVRTILERRRERPRGLDWPALLDIMTAGQQPSGGQPAGQGDGGNGRQQDLGSLERMFCVRSNAFFVRCLVREPGGRRTDAAMAVVYLPASSDEAARIVQWRQPDLFPGWSAWLRQPGEEEGLESGR